MIYLFGEWLTGGKVTNERQARISKDFEKSAKMAGVVKPQESSREMMKYGNGMSCTSRIFS